MKLNLIVLKSPNVEATKKFYESMGIDFTVEQHGDGLRHYAGIINEVLMESYPGGAGNEGLTMGFCVNDLGALQRTLISAGGKLIAEPTTDNPYLNIRDSDGRRIILTQQAE
jgi:predicted enzyme related to lactoylglutathione lyase